MNTYKESKVLPLHLEVICDVCHRSRAQKNHQRCSKIRQERHAQILRNETFDTMLMHDKNEK